MAYELKQAAELSQRIELTGRERLTVTGVQKVLHCNADSAAIETGRGILHLSGAQLSMAALNLEAGEAKFTGRIDTLEYTGSKPQTEGEKL